VTPVSAAAFCHSWAAAIYGDLDRQKGKAMFKLSTKLMYAGLVSANLLTLGFMVWSAMTAPLY
jgi:hypothetical protein